jgi:hypothetical protein
MELKLERNEQRIGAEPTLYPLDLTLAAQAVTVLLANEKPKGETIAYETLLNAWKAGKAR